jgi:hypothetical protein
LGPELGPMSELRPARPGSAAKSPSQLRKYKHYTARRWTRRLPGHGKTTSSISTKFFHWPGSSCISTRCHFDLGRHRSKPGSSWRAIARLHLSRITRVRGPSARQQRLRQSLAKFVVSGLSLRAENSTTARGFEHLRAEPNGFLVHHLNHSVTLSLVFTHKWRMAGREPSARTVMKSHVVMARAPFKEATPRPCAFVMHPGCRASKGAADKKVHPAASGCLTKNGQLEARRPSPGV